MLGGGAEGDVGGDVRVGTAFCVGTASSSTASAAKRLAMEGCVAADILRVACLDNSWELYHWIQRPCDFNFFRP